MSYKLVLSSSANSEQQLSTNRVCTVVLKWCCGPANAIITIGLKTDPLILCDCLQHCTTTSTITTPQVYCEDYRSHFCTAHCSVEIVRLNVCHPDLVFWSYFWRLYFSIVLRVWHLQFFFRLIFVSFTLEEMYNSQCVCVGVAIACV